MQHLGMGYAEWRVMCALGAPVATSARVNDPYLKARANTSSVCRCDIAHAPVHPAKMTTFDASSHVLHLLISQKDRCAMSRDEVQLCSASSTVESITVGRITQAR